MPEPKRVWSVSQSDADMPEMKLVENVTMSKTCRSCFHSAEVPISDEAECPNCGRVYAKMDQLWREGKLV